MKDHVCSGWSGAILVCGKCSKKAGGKPLAKGLRRELGLGKGRRATLGVVETKCLGICPRRGIVVIDTASPGRWRIVPSDASAAQVAVRLRLGARSNPIAPGEVEGHPSTRASTSLSTNGPEKSPQA